MLDGINDILVDCTDDLYSIIQSLHVNKEKYTKAQKIKIISVVKELMIAVDGTEQEENTVEYRLYNNKIDENVNERRHRFLVLANNTVTNCKLMFCIVCVFYAKGTNIFRTTGCKIDSYSIAHKHLCNHEKSKPHQNAMNEYLKESHGVGISNLDLNSNQIQELESTNSFISVVGGMPATEISLEPISAMDTTITNSTNDHSTLSLMSAASTTLKPNSITSNTITSVLSTTPPISFPVIAEADTTVPTQLKIVLKQTELLLATLFVAFCF